ncbi:MAG: family 20 glycosylhydrolase [Clostridia bacterium]|nr:family 20 glycosylhydrolase [Clostridia bacterium]
MLNNIIPIPKKVEASGGILIAQPRIYTDCPEWEIFVETAVDSFSRMCFFNFEKGEGGVILTRDNALKPASYTVSIDDKAVISAPDDEGICYGIATLLQLAELEGEMLTLEKCRIEDWGDKNYRALMLDLVSSWHPLDKVLRFMDVCFFEKVPYVHLHLIDNAACRIRSKAYPKLATPKYSYSYEDIETIRNYARARGLKLIPEFDIPGHARRLVNTYPEVFGNKLSNESEIQGAVSEVGFKINTDDVICAGSDECFDGMKTLFQEVAELFPESEYIHIGGDEAYIQVWDHCPVCQKYMKDNGISDRYELYSEYVARISKFVLELGRTPIVWEGFPRKGSERIPKETIVIAWESHYNIAPDLLEDGFKIINGSWQPLYIFNNSKRWTKEDIMNWNICEWQHWWEHSAATLNPIHVPNSDKLWGAQISIWGSTYENAISAVVENLAAMSERCWNLTRRTNQINYHNMSNCMSIKLHKLIQDR